jgi:uncharacterized protein YjbJ (UPF0337 family)
VIGSNEQPLKGVEKQVEGQIQKAFGNLEEVITDVGRK